MQPDAYSIKMPFILMKEIRINEFEPCGIHHIR